MLNNGLIWYMFLFVEYRCRKQKYCKAQNQSLNMFACCLFLCIISKVEMTMTFLEMSHQVKTA